MNSTSNSRPVTLVNIRDIIWDLLSQWKAVLIAALIMALLAAGAKYCKDINAYKAKIEQRQNEQTSEASSEEQIENILNALPEEERSSVEYMVQQQEWLNTQKEYLNNSILMINPTNQRMLVFDYYIASESNDDYVLTTLEHAYNAYANNDKIITELQKVIGLDIEKIYISELILNENNSADDGDAVVGVKVYVPDSVDASAVEKVFTDAFKEYSAELGKKVEPHSIGLISSAETRICNTGAVNNKNSITANIFNIQNNYLKNMELALSDRQKEAYHSIVNIKAAAAKAESAEDQAAEGEAPEAEAPTKPGISKKYTLLGFVLGAMVYAFLYVLYIFIKGKITSAGQVENYTGSRLIGEVYNEGEHSGLDKLFHSKPVNNIRYRGMLDEAKQTERAVSSLEAVCKHAETDSVSLLCLPGLRDGADKVIDSIVAAAKEKGVNAELFSVGEEIDENKLIAVKNGVIVAGNDSKSSDIIRLAQLCKDYEIGQLGNIYLKSI